MIVVNVAREDQVDVRLVQDRFDILPKESKKERGKREDGREGEGYRATGAETVQYHTVDQQYILRWVMKMIQGTFLRFAVAFAAK